MDITFPTTESLMSFLPVAIFFVVDFAIKLFMLFYIPRNRKPTAALAWLLGIYIIPILGTIAFFVIGNTKLSKNRRLKQHYMSKKIDKFASSLQRQGLVAPVQGNFRNSAVLAESFGGLPPVNGNDATIISGYENIIADIVDTLDTAKRYIYVEFFAMALDSTTEPFFAALERAVLRNVKVYVLFDSLGSNKYKDYHQMQQRLTSGGVKWHTMLPIGLRRGQYNRPDLRNHRKIVVIDNAVSYIGSLNMIQRTYKRKDDLEYIELMSKMSGPVVTQCSAVFASDWYSETGTLLDEFSQDTPLPVKGRGIVAQILPSGPGYNYENNLKLFISLMYSAQTSIAITNPYFVPDQSLLTAIISAAQRGVKVTLLNSEIMDQKFVGHAQRSYYDEIMRAGVDIYLYKRPILQHSKYMVVDESVAVVGSSNMDVRSFELDLECVALFYDPAISKTLHQLHTSQCRTKSTRLSVDSWSKRSLGSGLMDGIARLTSALQ